MKKLIVAAIAVLFISCGGDDPVNNCDFIGVWCIPVSGSCENSPTAADLELRENGEILDGAIAGRSWESEDCITIEIFSSLSDQKIEEYTVISVTDDTLVLDRGFGNTTYQRR